jgi:hypothetical protein
MCEWSDVARLHGVSGKGERWHNDEQWRETRSHTGHTDVAQAQRVTMKSPTDGRAFA